jgi:hypothetical protein
MREDRNLGKRKEFMCGYCSNKQSYIVTSEPITMVCSMCNKTQIIEYKKQGWHIIKPLESEGK